MSSTVAVRFTAGTMSESRREAHLAGRPAPDTNPDFWETYCGIHIPAEIAEVSDRPAGMPCMACMMRLPAAGGFAVDARGS
ncbi:hypothetical protein FHX42_001802 [Saccharopolyspora lacisalsi]|uniref:Uncharacterized protein n=1 Tax=Halosaccharopolyspora lacisalsi TaxID=1000566 RepID=A0A839DYL0_9PSEU|nr:hypothetical protein [Halosaccharopolyspora lacisalsi]MBA8824455.1 hypothetical protein [Halosaccharopolyspora lacisalsi]